ncbi:MAG: integration host factor subunit alpha [Oligoflexia bacterium]|nr:integration host factor subunit alpha [Bdellovibrionales bacterium]MYE07243.1 integration host factor subunit alpha [Oligoflexia bacterium]
MYNKNKRKKIKTLTKADIYLDLYDKIGYSRQRSADLVNSVFNIIREKLCSHYNVKLSGFGNFLLRDKKARMGRDPKTGRGLMIKGRRVLVFHPSPILRKKVNDQ